MIHETGQIDIGKILDIQGVGKALEKATVDAISSQAVQDELYKTARPLMLETAAYVAGAVAIVLLLLGRR